MPSRFQVLSFALLGLILIPLAACTAIPPAAPVTPTEVAATPAPIPPAAANAQGALARELGLDPAAITIVSVEPVDWPDACLGAGGPAEACALAVTPGYRITLEAADGRTYVYHTDATGSEIRPAPEASAGCPTNTADETALVQVAHGYCLLYPAGYNASEPNSNEVVLYAGSLLDVTHPKLFIQVADAGGATAEQVADAVVAEVQTAMPGFKIERSAATIGGEPAAVLDGVPGQDLSRQVITAHDGRAYKLVFVPADASQGEVYREMQTFYDLVLQSFRFLPRQ